MGFQFERDNKDNFVFIPPFSLCVSTTFLFYCNFSTVTGLCLSSPFLSALNEKKRVFQTVRART